jgi:hypothetical protein
MISDIYISQIKTGFVLFCFFSKESKIILNNKIEEETKNRKRKQNPIYPGLFPPLSHLSLSSPRALSLLSLSPVACLSSFS